ncbi:MAG: TonB-dependent receptor [Pseudomonadota bacterium]|nr:TonB-dependent receptor [Pseudomonadota bacterium]
MRKWKTAASALLATTMLSGLSGAFAQEVGDEIVVRGVNIPDEKRATSEISAVLDETAFQRTGDSDIAEALRRVTGLSLSQGRFVVVRGLNERYSSVTLNGSPLPSPEPLRRVVPLDIIPTSALSGTLVQKTFSPQYSAEFGGGLVELRTKSLPDEFFFEVGGSIGLDTETTFKDGLSYDGGKLDWLGFDDGTRSVPGPLKDVFESGLITSANQEAIDVSLDNAKTTVITSNTIPPNYSFNLAVGDRFDISNDISIGGTIALSLASDWQTREGVRQQGYGISSTPGAVLGIPGLEGQDVNFTSTENVVDLNGVASFGAEIGDNHTLTFTNLIFRSTEKQARISEGLDGADPFGTAAHKSNLQFLERQVWQTQLRGDHAFPSVNDMTVTWRAAYGKAFRDAPYQREYTYVRALDSSSFDPIFYRDLETFAERQQYLESNYVATDSFRYDAGQVTGSTPNTVFFSRIDDENFDAGIDFVLPLVVMGSEVDVKFGYAYSDKTRDTMSRNFEYNQNIGFPPEILTSRIDQLLAPSVVGTPILDLALLQAQIDLDNSTSTLTVHGAYVGLDAQLGEYVRVAAGGRFEDGEEVTSAYSTTSPVSSFIEVPINEQYFLPAVTVTWNPLGNLQVRAGFSQTITRPQFRELTPAFFIDDQTDLLIRGNPFLVNSEINNFDARIEYYFSRGQFITLGGFYKDITNPIEESFARDIGGIPVISYINAPSAELYGFEFEFERNFILADIVDWSMVATKDLVFKANYTFSQSSVSADGDVVTPIVSSAGVTPNVLPATSVFEDGRSLQGQSDHLFNIQLGVEDEENDSRATILVNFASARIRNVESIESGGLAPRVIERPPVSLDFVYSRGFERFGGDWEIGFKIENILGEDYEAKQVFPDGSVVDFDSYGLGRKISMSLKRTF